MFQKCFTGVSKVYKKCLQKCFKSVSKLFVCIESTELLYFSYFLEINYSKLCSVLSQSSRVFVPVDDPKQELLTPLAEVKEIISTNSNIHKSVDGVSR